MGQEISSSDDDHITLTGAGVTREKAVKALCYSLRMFIHNGFEMKWKQETKTCFAVRMDQKQKSMYPVTFRYNTVNKLYGVFVTVPC